MWDNHITQLLSTAEKRDTFSHYTMNEKEQFDNEREWERMKEKVSTGEKLDDRTLGIRVRYWRDFNEINR